MLERLEQQKTLTLNQWKIIATAGVGDMLDFFDFFLIGYVLAFILKDWHITYGQSAIILISAGLGAVPGAFFWGWMGDRIGRRKVFILTALNVAFATGIMYFTPQQGGWIEGWIFLSFFRFFVGFGNAGLIAVDIPLVQRPVDGGVFRDERGRVDRLVAEVEPGEVVVCGEQLIGREEHVVICGRHHQFVETLVVTIEGAEIGERHGRRLRRLRGQLPFHRLQL